MLECHEFIRSSEEKTTRVSSLPFDQRQKSRAQALTTTGEKFAWFIERGSVLADGDILVATSGEKIRVIAAAETVSEVTSIDSLLLMRAVYHLGNRHVPLQIDRQSLRYQHDHVLDDMVRGLGLDVSCVEKPFHPEAGAYHTHAHHHHAHD